MPETWWAIRAESIDSDEVFFVVCKDGAELQDYIRQTNMARYDIRVTAPEEVSRAFFGWFDA